MCGGGGRVLGEDTVWWYPPELPTVEVWIRQPVVGLGHYLGINLNVLELSDHISRLQGFLLQFQHLGIFRKEKNSLHMYYK